MRLAFLVVGLSIVGCSASDDSGGGPSTGGSAGKTGGGGSASGGTAGSASGGAAGAAGASGAASGGSAATGGIGVIGSGGTAGAGGSAGNGSAAWACPAGPFDTPAASGTPTQVTAVPPQDGFVTSGWYNVEGPVWIGDALYVSQMIGGDTPPSRILKVTAAGAVSIAIAEAGTNGLAVDKDGNLIGTRHTDGSVSKFDLGNPTNVTVIADEYMAKRFNSPNDLAIRSDGNIYFSDPTHQNSANPQGGTRTYRIAPGGAVSLVDGDHGQPNGVTLSLDQNTLYVNTQAGLYKYAVNADGSTQGGVLFSGMFGGGDGMGMDCAGNLYVTNSKRVTILDASANEVAHVDVPSADNITNVAFGGPEHKTLYITYLGTAAGLYKVEMNLPGMPY